MLKSIKKITGYLGISLLILVAPGLLYFQSGSGKSQIANYLEDYFHKHFAVRLEIAKLDYSLFPLTLVLTDARIAGHQEQKLFLVANRIFVELPYSNLWKETITIRKLEIHSAELDL
jgi:uncharacterized protein (DUF1697 family)